MAERRILAVPWPILALLGLALVAQIALSAWQPRPAARAVDLPPPPSSPALHVLSLGDPIPLAQVMTLYLQAFDNQPGVSVPFAKLDYGRVQTWLERILDLDPRGQYPLLMASQLYAQVPVEGKQRQMLEFVYREFLEDPNRRWPWLAHAAIMARHRLHDLPLALRFATALSAQATGPEVPHWARQMHIFFHEDMGEYETARVLRGGLLASGTVTDPHEMRLLFDRLNELNAAEKSSSMSKK